MTVKDDDDGVLTCVLCPRKIPRRLWWGGVRVCAWCEAAGKTALDAK